MNLKSEKWWAGVKLLPSLFGERKQIGNRNEGCDGERATAGANTPGEEDALHHVEVLHQHVPLRLGAQVADGVADAQLDGPLQGRGGGLEAERIEASRQRERPSQPGRLRPVRAGPGGENTHVPSCRWSLQRHPPFCGQSSSRGPGPLLTETASDQTEPRRVS